MTFVLIDMCVCAELFMRGLFQGREGGRPLGNRTGAGGVKIVTTRADVCFALQNTHLKIHSGEKLNIPC